MPCYDNVFIHIQSVRKEVNSDYVMKRCSAYCKVKNILNYKYCSFAIVDKEKDMLEKIKKIINEVEDAGSNR